MKNIAPNIIEEMSGNSICQESPGKHPGKEHLLMFWIKEASIRIHPGNTHEMPRKHPGKVHLLMFWIKGASLEKNFFSKSCGDF